MRPCFPLLQHLDLRHGSLSTESRESEDTAEAIQTVLGSTGKDNGPTGLPVGGVCSRYSRTEVIRGAITILILYQHQCLHVKNLHGKNVAYATRSEIHPITIQLSQAKLPTWWFMPLLNLNLICTYISTLGYPCLLFGCHYQTTQAKRSVHDFLGGLYAIGLKKGTSDA